jgi:adenine-specific DNA-methyltransferase
LSRLNDLLRQLRMENPGMADDLQREYDALADRRSFGLNFERHVPEAVELPGRKVRKGDKVRVLPPRGQARKRENDRLWRVISFSTEDGLRQADLVALDNDDHEASAAVDDLVVVAEFRDPIYPGLVSTGKVERGGDKPYHAVINAENYHALQTLLFTHLGRVDCIYIDPPYNTGAKDWKYNNDYVEGDDLYRHSKWLAFMERRLLLAKELLNPDDSALIVTIDEKEYLRLGMLLQQVFPEARMQMVSALINPQGVSAGSGRFSRVDEYLFFVTLGDAQLTKWSRSMIENDKEANDVSDDLSVRWADFARYGGNATRKIGPGAFFPIFVDIETETIHSVGDALPWDVNREDVEAPEGTRAVWPPSRPDGEDGRWRVVAPVCRELVARGFIKVGPYNKKSNRHSFAYLQSGTVEKIDAGEIVVKGYDEKGAAIVEYAANTKVATPKTIWTLPSHDASRHGANLLAQFLPGRRFPFPKSLYAVEDAVRFYTKDKPRATVLDFFSGSGTTAHAVMRLNRQDGGTRRSICVTNNEVSSTEQAALRSRGLRPGDSEWEALGICEYITKPRIRAAVTGQTHAGSPVKGEYRFTDEFPMSEGFEENVEFFTLTYEAPLRVASNREFEKVAPLLWLRAGSHGRRIDDISKGWDVADVYGVVEDLDHAEPFLKAIAENDDVAMAFIVTDEDRLFESMVAALPDHVEPVRLYESYLRNFEIEAGRGTR